MNDLYRRSVIDYLAKTIHEMTRTNTKCLVSFRVSSWIVFAVSLRVGPPGKLRLLLKKHATEVFRVDWLHVNKLQVFLDVLAFAHTNQRDVDSGS